MSFFNWTKGNFLPMSGLEAWHQYDAADSANGLCKDYSGNGRDIAQVTTPPTLDLAAPLGQPGWHFNGSCNPLKTASAPVSLKHIFMVASASDATFSAARGLLTGLTTGDLLVSNSSGATFQDTGATSFAGSGLSGSASDPPAPVAGNATVIELVYDDVVDLDGILVGAQRNVGSTTWNGYFYELLAYSEVMNDNQRLQVQQYFAMRYLIWPQSDLGS